MEASTSSSTSVQPSNTGLSPRQREKQPAREVNIDGISLDESKLDQEIAILFSQYLDSRSYGHIARIIDEEILNHPHRQEREEVELIERALTGEPITQTDV